MVIKDKQWWDYHPPKTGICALHVLHGICTLYTLLIGWDFPTQPITLLAFETHFYMYYMHYVDYMHYMQYVHYMHPSQVSDWLWWGASTNQKSNYWHLTHTLACITCIMYIMCVLHRIVTGWGSPLHPIKLLAFNRLPYMSYMYYVHYMYYMKYAH